MKIDDRTTYLNTWNITEQTLKSQLFLIMSKKKIKCQIHVYDLEANMECKTIKFANPSSLVDR